MWCISTYEYVVGKTKMTEIFAWALCWIMSVVVSLMLSMLSSYYSYYRIDFSIRVVIQSCLPYVCCIYSWWPLGHQLFSFHLFILFDVAHNHYVVASNVDLLMTVTSVTMSGLLLKM